MNVSFTVPGRVPSKSNFRFANNPKARSEWQRILQYQQEVGMEAMAAGTKTQANLSKSKARVKVLLVNQDIDIDNGLKVILDGLKNVAFVDDSPKYLEAVQVCWAEDDGPVRAEYRIEWS